MKKTICVFLSFIMITAFFLLSACGDKSGNKNEETTDNKATDYTLDEESLYGNWIDIDTTYSLTISRGNAASFKSNYTANGTWHCENNTISINTGRLNGDFEIKKDEKGTISLVNNNYCFMRFSDLPMTEGKLSEILSDETISITLESVNFVDKIPNELYLKLKGWGLEYGNDSILEDGQVYAMVIFQLTNKGKEPIIIGSYDNLLRIIIDYDNGYLFSTNDANYSYFYDGTNLSGYYEGSLGDEIQLQPLQTKRITVYLRCSDTVSKDSSSPLDICFISTCEVNKASYSRYVVR